MGRLKIIGNKFCVFFRNKFSVKNSDTRNASTQCCRVTSVQHMANGKMNIKKSNENIHLLKTLIQIEADDFVDTTDFPDGTISLFT